MVDDRPSWYMKPPLSTAAPSRQMVLLEILLGYREIIKGPKTHMQIRMGHVILLPPVLGEIMGEVRLGVSWWRNSTSLPQADSPPTTTAGDVSEGRHLSLHN